MEDISGIGGWKNNDTKYGYINFLDGKYANV